MKPEWRPALIQELEVGGCSRLYDINTFVLAIGVGDLNERDYQLFIHKAVQCQAAFHCLLGRPPLATEVSGRYAWIDIEGDMYEWPHKFQLIRNLAFNLCLDELGYIPMESRYFWLCSDYIEGYAQWRTIHDYLMIMEPIP